MRGTKRIVDEKVAELSKRCGKRGIVLLFSREESRILEQQYLVVGQCVRRFDGGLVIGRVDESHFLPDELIEPVGDRSQGIFRFRLSCRATEMRENDRARAAENRNTRSSRDNPPPTSRCSSRSFAKAIAADPITRTSCSPSRRG